MSGRVIRDLGDGLVLRRGTVADAEALATFNADYLREPEMPEPDEAVGLWTRDLATRPHPTFDVGDFTIVEDSRTGSIVSSLCLIPQTWAYDGVAFGVGRPELVATHPDYRGRGLIRAQFEVVHRWSAERGHKLQAITGIPYFYRQFGYEMTVALDAGRGGYMPNVPKLETGKPEPYRVRPATEADLPFFAEVYERAARRYLLSCVRDAAIWRYDLGGRSPRAYHQEELRVIETPAGEPVGYLAHHPVLHGGEIVLNAYELKPGVPWGAVTPSVVRYLQATAEAYAARDGKGELAAYTFLLGPEHPCYQLSASLLPRTQWTYAWYLRVADLPDFLRTIAPALERRLAGSDLAGHTGELKISWYRGGARLAFERGRLVRAEPWQPTQADWGSAKFPDRTFLHVLFGHRSVEELEHVFADVGVRNDEARALLRVLFPKQASSIWPVA